MLAVIANREGEWDDVISYNKKFMKTNLIDAKTEMRDHRRRKEADRRRSKEKKIGVLRERGTVEHWNHVVVLRSPRERGRP